MGVLLGKKLGMTQLFLSDGRTVACTVIEAGPCPIVQLRTRERDGYEAIQIGFEPIPERKLTLPSKGHFARSGLQPLRYLREFRVPPTPYKVGDLLTVQQFAPGDKVKVTGQSKGRGFQGVVRRHGFGGVGMATHGQHNRERAPGSVGSSSFPSRVFKGMRMAGRMGNQRVTVRNLEVLKVLPEHNLLLVKGAVPGPVNGLVEIVKLS
ncbi:MAG: 50S ribosomal protein L3 [Candidatus Kapabacteria bacterium]|nr:50S ribosomal protein L3 [Candidatus Kapabacteria bacterium]MCS7169473.1 50S ribosomal protein L3 [Candidatus Kapabacteria bacterium]MDW7997230.1 50S ribosomal protein L3 [Bacteroidota bacterium]MDW8224713.1 50S ribosomal protein L3 [Bacteroidota bacterium]